MISRENYPNLENFDSIVMFSTADWDNPFWTNKQHMACHLANAGFKVLYIESLGLRKVAAGKSDISRIKRRLIRFFTGAKLVRDNVWVWSPIVLPLHDRPWAQWLNSLFLRAMITYYRWRLGFSSSIGWTYNPLVENLLKSLRFKAVIYHSVDDLSAAPRLPKEQIELKEKELLCSAAATFVTSPTLFEKYKGLESGRLFYYPNVADYEHFQMARRSDTLVPREIATLPSPRIGFVGAISGYKLDFEMISSSAEKTPQWSWVLIGKVGEGDPDTDISRLQKPNIHLLGPRSYKDLPSYLKGFDVVIIPCPQNDYTKAMFPMKFFEYLAAGKVIVATELPSLKEFGQAFLPAANSEEMVEQIDRVLNGEVVFNETMEKFARENTWSNRLKKMLEDIDGALNL